MPPGALAPMLLILAAGSPSESQEPEPLRMASRAFGSRVEIEVRDLPRGQAKQAIQAALAEMRTVEALLDPRGEVEGGVGRLNATAGQGPASPDPRLFQLLVRAQNFCLWSNGAHGPLGGRLYRLWDAGATAPAPPTPDLLEEARQSASCDHLVLDLEAGTVTMAGGSLIDLRSFAPGFAADRAAEILKDHGATDGWIEVGRVKRGFGPGPGGRGWPVVLPVFAGLHQPLDEIWLRNRAVAIMPASDRQYRAGEAIFLPYLNLRRGRPPEGTLAVVAVTELAADAQGLATTMLVTGPRQGQLLLGNLRPTPSVLWILGSGSGQPLFTDYHWSDLKMR